MITYNELKSKAILVPHGMLSTRTQYITSFAKILDCEISPHGRRVIFLPLTSSFDDEYCRG